jgi:hypothetical protein
MQAKSILMSEGSGNAIETSNSVLASQRRMDDLDASPLMQPVPWEAMASLILLSTIGVLIYACIPKRKQHSSKVTLPITIKCFSCQYFNDNHYIECALHPLIVMTEQVVDCKDYYPKAESNRAEKLKKILLMIKEKFS